MVTSPAGLTYGTISFSVGQLLSAGTPLTGITGAITVRPDVRGSILANSTPPVTLTSGPWTFDIVNGVMQDADGNTSISLVASDCPVINPSGWTYKASYGVNGINHGVIHFALPGGSHVDLTTVGTIPTALGDVRILGPQGIPGPRGPQGIVVSPNLADLPPNGVLFQTGLGPGGTDFTLWYDDGTP